MTVTLINLVRYDLAASDTAKKPFVSNFNRRSQRPVINQITKLSALEIADMTSDQELAVLKGGLVSGIGPTLNRLVAY